VIERAKKPFHASSKVPKHEIFDPGFLPPLNVIMEGHSMWKRIFSNSLFLPRYSFFSQILVCRAYTYNLYTYTEHTLTNCRRMLSIRLWIICVCSACASEHIESYVDDKSMLSIRLQMVWVCWAYACESYAYAQCTCTICKGTLSIRILSQNRTEHMLTIFPQKKPNNFLENA